MRKMKTIVNIYEETPGLNECKFDKYKMNYEYY